MTQPAVTPEFEHRAFAWDARWAPVTREQVQSAIDAHLPAWADSAHDYLAAGLTVSTPGQGLYRRERHPEHAIVRAEEDACDIAAWAGIPSGDARRAWHHVTDMATPLYRLSVEPCATCREPAVRVSALQSHDGAIHDRASRCSACGADWGEDARDDEHWHDADDLNLPCLDQDGTRCASALSARTRSRARTPLIGSFTVTAWRRLDHAFVVGYGFPALHRAHCVPCGWASDPMDWDAALNAGVVHEADAHNSGGDSAGAPAPRFR